MSLFAPIVPPPARVGLYQTVMADPPWLERGGGQIKRGADRHYPLMKTAEIAALPVESWAAPNAHAYIWVTNNFLPDGLHVMKAWGFRYVTKIDWFKGAIEDIDQADIAALVERVIGAYDVTCLTAEDVPQIAHRIAFELAFLPDPKAADEAGQMGIGQYYRGVTESCLFGVRGSLPYRAMEDGRGGFIRAQGRTGFHAPRGAHSAKPAKFRQMVERVSHGPRLEMFARETAPGWDVWGNEVAA